MAEALITGSQLRIVFAAGVDEFGKPQYKTKNYNNIKPSATAEELLQAANAIIGLQSLELDKVERNNSHLIIES